MRLPPIITVFSLSATVFLSGCHTAPQGYEQAARDQLDQVAYAHAATVRPDPSTLTAQSTPADYLRFALQNHPQVAVAHARWRAQVAAISPARSLPDPKLTLQADIANTVMSVMPGIMFDFMSTGKRDAMGREAAAGAEVARTQFDAATQQVATQLRKAWIELAYVDAARDLHGEAANSVAQSIALAEADYATAPSGMGLGQQIELQNERAEHHVHHAILSDRLQAARIAFKSALGLRPTDRDPPWPEFPISAETLP
ncbi:MAG: TolC family protein, partial [Cephaloticoccus sp.]|nr:TolC family protein [Cephaloticoccus sp.]